MFPFLFYGKKLRKNFESTILDSCKNESKKKILIYITNFHNKKIYIHIDDQTMINIIKGKLLCPDNFGFLL